MASLIKKPQTARKKAVKTKIIPKGLPKRMDNPNIRKMLSSSNMAAMPIF